MLPFMSQLLEIPVHLESRAKARSELRQMLLAHLQNSALRLFWTSKREAEKIISALGLRPLEAFTPEHLARGSPHAKDAYPKVPTAHRCTRLALAQQGDAPREELSAYTLCGATPIYLSEDELYTLIRLDTALLKLERA